MVGKDAFQIKNKQNQLFHKRMFATTGASQARSPITMGATQRFAGGIIGFAVIALGVAFLHPFTHESSYATNTNVVASYSGEDWTISAPTSTAADAGGLTFDIEGNPTGVNMAKKDTVTSGSTNVPDYQIYVSVNTEGGKIPNTSNSDYSIAATSGTVTDATTNVSGAAALSSNSWGYALDSFNTNINYNDLVSSSSSSSWSSSKWSKLPYVATSNLTDDGTVTGTAAKIYDSTTNSGDSVDVYYAVNADNNLASGEYQTTVTYTLIGEIPVTIPDYLQDMTPETCAALKTYDSGDAEATTYSIKDARDNQDYRVRRLKMGTGSGTACWMVDNLKLTKTTIEAAGNSAKLDANTSNVASNSAFELTASDSSTWCTDQNSTCYDKPMVIDTSYGTLYNWFAATAGTGTYSTSSGTATASICPGKGTTSSSTWHLPTGNTNNEWYQLFQAYQSDYGWSTINGTSNTGTMTNTWSTTIGPDFIYSGYRSGANTGGQSSTGSGRWWSSTASNNYTAYNANLYYNYRYVYGGTDSSGKYYGYAVRCVLTAASS